MLPIARSPGPLVSLHPLHSDPWPTASSAPCIAPTISFISANDNARPVPQRWLVSHIVQAIKKGNWITAFQQISAVKTRRDIMRIFQFLVDQKLEKTPQAEHLARRLFSIIPYDGLLEHSLKNRCFKHFRDIGKASADASLWDLAAHPHLVVTALSSLSTVQAHQLLEYVYAQGRMAQLILHMEEEFLLPSKTESEIDRNEEWASLEIRLATTFQKPEDTPHTEKLSFVARYIGIPNNQEPLSESSTLSLFSKNPQMARKIWRKAQREPHYLDYLFRAAQLSIFLEDEGKTIYKAESALFTFSALVTTNEGVCETFSFLYACLAPIVGLQVYGGCYPGHLFLYLALDGLVNETTADYNLRHSTAYLEKAAVDDEYQDPIPAYLLIRWRLIQTSLMHMTGNAGYWDPRLLMIGNRLFPKDPFFQGSSFQTQLALAHFSTGNQKQALSICKKLGPQSIRYDVLLLILASHQQRGLTQQAKIIEDFIAHLKKN